MTGRIAFLALGSNLGDRRTNLDRAVERIGGSDNVVVAARTEPEETVAVGVTDQPRFLNQMLAVRTSLGAEELLALCQAVEAAGGRIRDRRWGPRTIDVDIVEIEGVVVDHPDLVVPHPEINNRDFWIRELAQLKRQLSQGGVDG